MDEPAGLRLRSFSFAVFASLLQIAVNVAAPAQAEQSALQTLLGAGGGRILNVRNFGASGSNRTVDVVVTKGSSIVKVPGEVGDFTPGQAITILRAGNPPAVAAPNGLTGSAISYDERGIIRLPCRVDRANAGCDARWSWRIIAVDAKLGSSAPSAPLLVDHAPLTPNPTNRIHLVWNSDPAAVSYLMYGCEGDGCTPKLRAVLPNNWYTTPGGRACQGCARPRYMVYDYLGHDFGTDELSGKAMPAGARNQSFHATIRSISGHSIEVSQPLRMSAATRMVHDDAPAFQAAIDRLRRIRGVNGSGGVIVIPPGQYPIGQTLDFYRASAIRFAGLGTGYTTQLIWRGGAGGIVMNLNQARDLVLENFEVTDFDRGSTPAVIIDIDKYDQGDGIKSAATHDELRNLNLERSGVAVRLGNRSNSNCELMEFRNVVIGAAYNGEGGWYGYYIAGGGETYDERIDGGTVAFRDAAVYLNRVGSVDSYVLNLSHNFIDWYVNDFASWHVVEIGSDSEGAAHHLYVAFAHPHGLRFVIANSRLITATYLLASDGYYIVDNASLGLQLSGNLIEARPAGSCKVMFSNGDSSAPLISAQNQFSDPQPFVTPPGIRRALISIQDVAGYAGRLHPISPPIDPAAANLIASMLRSASLSSMAVRPGQRPAPR